jgi:hypothetical protein
MEKSPEWITLFRKGLNKFCNVVETLSTCKKDHPALTVNTLFLSIEN